MHRPPTGLVAVAWLLVMHALANIAVVVFRSQEIDRAVLDVLAVSLMRGQLCLLTLWLAAGNDRWSWRVCGFLGGACFIFVLFTRTVFPVDSDLSPWTVWLEREWIYYFRWAGPGDLLVKAPWLVSGVVLPVFIARFIAARRRKKSDEEPATEDPPATTRSAFQFGFRDAAVWLVTISMVMAALYQTSPYPAWLRELVGHWRSRALPAEGELTTRALGAGVYCLISLAALWLVNSTRTFSRRLIVFVILSAALAAVAAALATDQGATPRVEAYGLLITAFLIAGSMGLYRFYERIAERL